MSDRSVARSLDLVGLREVRGPAAGGDDRWRELIVGIGDSLMRSAQECQDQVFKAQDPVLAEQLQMVRRLATRWLENIAAARTSVERATFRAGGMFADLRGLIRRFTLRCGIDADLRLPRREPEIAEEIAWALHTVADEALDGLALRSRATGLVLTLASTADSLSLTMRDDGVGLIARQGPGWRASPHAALRTIRRALEAVDGTARLSALRPRGLLLRTEIPIQAPDTH